MRPRLHRGLLQGVLAAALCCGCGNDDPQGLNQIRGDTVALAYRDSVDGFLNGPGEIDVFTFAAAAGDLFRVYAQLDLQIRQTTFKVIGPDGQDFGTDISGRPDFLLGMSSGLLQARTTGRHEIVFSTRFGRGSPYRVFLYDVRPAPETASPGLAVGDSVVGEDLDAPGDIDTFAVHLGGTDTLNLIDWVGRNSVDSLAFHIFTADSQQRFFQYRYGSQDSLGYQIGASGNFALGPGTYRLQVTRPVPSNGAPVAYKLNLNRVSAAPESGEDSIRLGVAISEQLEPVGDIDVYTLAGHANQQYQVKFQGFAPGTLPPWIRLELGDEIFGDSLMNGSPGRYVLPADSLYTVTVQSQARGTAVREHGTYTLTLAPVDTLPETTPGVVSLGTTITTEGLQSTGDLDRFSTSVAAGNEVQLLFRSLGPQSPGELVLAQWLGDSGDILVGEQAALTTTWGLGRRVVPSSGVVRYQFGWKRSGYGAPKLSKQYEFTIVPIDRAPETTSPVLAMNDTTTGEAIEPIGDIDEFTYTAQAGESIRLFVEIDGAIRSQGALNLQVLRLGNPTPLLDFYATDLLLDPIVSPPVTLAESGAYLIRAAGWGNLGDRTLHGSYRLAVVP